MTVSFGDKSIDALRILIRVIERELAATPTSPQLRAAWNELVRILSLGAAPELRTCPRCNRIGMRAASTCSNCYLPLPNLGVADDAD